MQLFQLYALILKVLFTLRRQELISNEEHIYIKEELIKNTQSRFVSQLEQHIYHLEDYDPSEQKQILVSDIQEEIYNMRKQVDACAELERENFQDTLTSIWEIDEE